MAVVDAYKNLYYLGATHLFFREKNPVRNAASYVYTNAGSGALTPASGQFAVAKYGKRELHYQPRVLASGSLAISIEGRASFMGTFSQIATIVLTSAQPNKMSIFSINEAVDYIAIGVRAASPAAADYFTAYGVFR